MGVATICASRLHAADWVLSKAGAEAANGAAHRGIAIRSIAMGGIGTSTTSMIGMVADHVEHIVRVAGIDGVGLGGDCDGAMR